MVALAGIRALERVADTVDIINDLCASCLQHRDKFAHNSLHNSRIITGTVMVELGQIQMV